MKAIEIWQESQSIIQMNWTLLQREGNMENKDKIIWMKIYYCSLRKFKILRYAKTVKKMSFRLILLIIMKSEAIPKNTSSLINRSPLSANILSKTSHKNSSIYQITYRASLIPVFKTSKIHLNCPIARRTGRNRPKKCLGAINLL